VRYASEISAIRKSTPCHACGRVYARAGSCPAHDAKRALLCKQTDPAQARETAKIYARNWRATNRDKVKISNKKQYRHQRQWAREHKLKIAVYNRVYTQKVKGEPQKRWRANNPLKLRDYWARYDRYTRSAPAVDYSGILLKYGMMCHICERSIKSLNELHFDHVVPVSRGGKHTAENILPSHAKCNLLKSNKRLSELTPELLKLATV